MVQVYDGQTGRTIWARRARCPRLIRWSADRAAVVVLDERVGESNNDWYELLVWRNGERLHRIRLLPPFRRFEMVRDLIWSPDKRGLLLLGPYSQGEADQGFSRLWCLRLRGNRAQLLANEAVTRAEWAGATRVRYWTGRLVSRASAPGQGTIVEVRHERTCR